MALRRLPAALRLGAWLPAQLQVQQVQLGQDHQPVSLSSPPGAPPLHYYLSRGWWPGPAAAAALCTARPVLMVSETHLASSSIAEATPADPRPSSGERLNIRIKTGNLRGAGTGAPAYITLVGSLGESDRIMIGDVEGSTFERASSRTFELNVSRSIGQLRRVHIERARESIGQLGAGWFLEQVEVQAQDGERVVFPCNSWLGESDSGDIVGALERNLLPAAQARPLEVHHPVQVQAAGMAIPHPEKVMNDHVRGVNRKGFGFAGEDAYYYCHGRNNIFGMGVADGIYAWRKQGIDSGKMARALMECSMHMVQEGHEDVLKALQCAKQHTESERLLGSSTACVLTINQEAGQLHAANLGDSGFLVLGTSGSSDEVTLKFRTNQLEHEFGRPFQLGHHEHASLPEDAELTSLQVSAGDTVVMGTDGLLDNLGEWDIMNEVNRMRRDNKPPAVVAQRLVKLAFEASMDRRRVTPYSKAASEAFDMVYSGGKPDDITVIVAYCE